MGGHKVCVSGLLYILGVYIVHTNVYIHLCLSLCILVFLLMFVFLSMYQVLFVDLEAGHSGDHVLASEPPQARHAGLPKRHRRSAEGEDSGANTGGGGPGAGSGEETGAQMT